MGSFLAEEGAGRRSQLIGQAMRGTLLLLLLRLGGALRLQPASGDPQLSTPGCRAHNNAPYYVRPGFWGFLHMPWREPGLPAVNRVYAMSVPSGYDPKKPAPLLIVFPGWGDGAWYHWWYDFGTLAEQEGYVVIYPKGMTDCDSEGCADTTSWNCGGTSTSNSSMMSCDPSAIQDSYCYSSCITKKGSCHPCDWTTCYDDVSFIRALVNKVSGELCLDRQRFYAHGCSNGAMFTHELARGLPGVFAGIVSSCGGKPHKGWEGRLPVGGPPISVATIGGRNDHTIPRSGDGSQYEWWDGYYYVSEQRLIEIYKGYNQCQNTATRRYNAGFHASNMTCWEEGHDCLGGASVARCSFNGRHDFNEGTGRDDIMDEMQFAFRFYGAHPLSAEFLLP